jgi:uncharacterized protein with ParB-like and HNH nuclease domain
MPGMKIQGKEYIIDKIFSGEEFTFVIPEYQRPYSWGIEQAEELIEDILAMMGDDENLDVSEMPPYFLGSIVLIKEEGYSESIVVDGQQRLTTLTILLSTLRCVGNVHEITPYLYQAKQKYVVGSEDHFRLLLREEDRELFQKYIQENDGFAKLIELDGNRLSDSQINIVQNGKLFYERLSKLSQKRRDQLISFLLNQCILIVVTSLDRDSAYRIFSILNDRGLDLSYTDILKAEIIGKLTQENVKPYAKKWVQLEDDLGREPFEGLFAHIRMIYRPYKIRQTILKEFRDYVISRHSPKQLVDDVLIPNGESFKNILTESYEATNKAEEINHLFSWLNRIDNTDWIPPAIRYLTDNRNEPSKLLQYFTLLERLAASMFIQRINITKRIDRYGKILQAIEKGVDILADGSPLQLDEVEIFMTKIALNADVYNLSRASLYILERLDNALSDGTATYNYKTISIEHVLPQNPDPDSQWLQCFSDEKNRILLTNQIGNLVLLNRRKNSSAYNYEFDIKKEKYFKKNGISPFPLTTDVLNEDKWTPEVIERRQKKLVDILIDLWDLNVKT